MSAEHKPHQRPPAEYASMEAALEEARQLCARSDTFRDYPEFKLARALLDLYEQIESDAYYKLWQVENEKLQRLEEQLEVAEKLLQSERVQSQIAKDAERLADRRYFDTLEQLEAAQREIRVLTFAAENRWKRMEEAEEQLETAREALTDISLLPGNLSARVIADRWLDSYPAKERDA